MKITRGDSTTLRVKLIDRQGEPVDYTPDKMYFTMKYGDNVDDVLIQKTLDNGIIFNDYDNCYYVSINPQDTSNLPYGKYVYDVEIIKGDFVRTINIGEIELTREVTFRNNENGSGKDEDENDNTIIVCECDVDKEYVDNAIQHLIDNDIQTLDDLIDENTKNINNNKQEISKIDNRVTNLEQNTPNGNYVTEKFVEEQIQGLVDGDIANLTDLITKNQDNIITNFNTEKSDNGLIKVNAVTKNGNIEVMTIYNGLDGKYPYSALAAGQINNIFKKVDEKINQAIASALGSEY